MFIPMDTPFDFLSSLHWNSWSSMIPFIPLRYCVVILLFPTSVFVLQGIYNQYLHPLHHFPGPFWGGFTDFYKLYIFAATHIPSQTMKLHARYGPFVRLAPNLLSFNDPQLIPEVYRKCVNKTRFYTPAVMGEYPSMFWTLKHSDHVPKRRTFSPSLSMKHFREHEGVIDERIIKLHDELNQRFAQTGQVFDFAEWARWFLNDTVTHFTFGEPTGFISEGRDIDGLIKALHSMGIMTGLVAALPWLFEPLIKNRFLKRFILPQSGNKTGSGKIMTHRDKLVMKRLDEAGTKEHDDVLAVLLKTKTLDGGKPSILDIKAECLSFMIAASDTTAGLVSPLIASVIERPKVYEKVMLEIDRFEREERISRPVASFDETNEMAYFMSCVKETLRLFPPTPIILPRFVCQGGLNLGEHMHIPEGTEIAANPWVTNRDPTVFGRDADKFRPERWLEVNELQLKEMEKLIFTFGHGSRECIGKNLALLEAQKLCLQLLREFELRSTSPNKPWTCKDRGISIYENQWMTIQARRPYDDSGSK